jgi:hypothetical protein
MKDIIKIGIQSSSSISLTKKDLIALIEENFKDARGHEGIAVLTTVKSQDKLTQSLTLCKVIELSYL